MEIKRKDNNLFKMTNCETGEIKYFTSINRIANYFNVQRIQVEVPYKRCGKYKNYDIEIIDGSEIKYKDID